MNLKNTKGNKEKVINNGGGVYNPVYTFQFIS